MTSALAPEGCRRGRAPRAGPGHAGVRSAAQPGPVARHLRHGVADLPVLGAACGVGIMAALVWAAVLWGRIPAWALAPWLACCLCWTANTLAHLHLHRPLFRARHLNRAFDLYLSLLMGLPQSLWRARHLWHHAGEPPGGVRRVTRARLLPELLALAALLGGLLAAGRPEIWLAAGLGWLAGLGLCGLQGWAEHLGTDGQGEAGVSCYAAWYNRLWFNDGYHREHHRWPGRHWRRLPGERVEPSLASPWPPLLRPLALLPDLARDALPPFLDRLEAVALSRPRLQAWLLRCHGRALDRVLAQAGCDPSRLDGALVVGGGLFPRSALLLRQRAPGLPITVLDARPEHLEAARACLRRRGLSEAGFRFTCGTFDATRPASARGEDIGRERPDEEGPGLAIVPLAYRGDRQALYRHPPAPLTLVHDWAWRRRGERGCLVSPWLLKRLNLVRWRAGEA